LTRLAVIFYVCRRRERTRKRYCG